MAAQCGGTLYCSVKKTVVASAAVAPLLLAVPPI
jgi:hypothetical protein